MQTKTLLVSEVKAFCRNDLYLSKTFDVYRQYDEQYHYYSSDNYEVPILPNIDSMILEQVQEDVSRLSMDTWHTCDTTHCRAGWAVHLCGEQGKVLEKRLSPLIAGSLIYAFSRPGKPLPNFFASDKHALVSIKEDAKEEKRQQKLASKKKLKEIIEV